MKNKNFRIKLGIFLMIFSGVFFAITLAVPLLDLPAKTRFIAATASFILMEIVFWSGGLLVGKELFVKYKKQMNPMTWFRRKKQESENTTGN
ncbi:MAG: transporter suffix domain-containing protein [Bacteroidales bacterium]